MRPTWLANAHAALDAAVERATATPGAPGPRATDVVAATPPVAEPQPVEPPELLRAAEDSAPYH